QCPWRTEPGKSSRTVRDPSDAERLEPGQGDFRGHVIKNDFDRQPAAELATGCEQVGDDPRTLFEFDFHDVVGNVALVAAEIRLMKNHPRADATAAAERRPAELARPAARAER